MRLARDAGSMELRHVAGLPNNSSRRRFAARLNSGVCGVEIRESIFRFFGIEMKSP